METLTRSFTVSKGYICPFTTSYNIASVKHVYHFLISTSVKYCPINNVIVKMFIYFLLILEDLSAS